MLGTIDTFLDVLSLPVVGREAIADLLCLASLTAGNIVREQTKGDLHAFSL